MDPASNPEPTNPNQPEAAPPATPTTPPADTMPPAQIAPEAPAVVTPTVGVTPPVAVTPATPAPAETSEAPSAVVVSTMPDAPANAPSPFDPAKKKRKLSKPIIAALVLLLVVIAGAAYYFGYYTSDSTVYKQSLKNTGKGYDKLVSYSQDQTKLGYKGFAGDGAFKFTSKDFSTDGKLSYSADDKNGQLKFDVGLATTRVEAEVRAIDSPTESPDVYVKASGIKGLGSLAGFPELDTSLAGVDNTWIAIDHSLLDSATQAASGSGTEMMPPTQDQINDELRAFGEVNKDYIFTTNSDKAVLKKVSSKGKETIDGRKTYRYTVSLDKANVKKYLKAQQEALKTSKLNKWVTDNKYETMVNESFADAIKSADKIKESDTADVWFDAGKRVIYKVRFTDPGKAATEYIDLGLDYKGGDDFPFFLSGKTKDSGSDVSFKVTANLNTKTNASKLTIDVKASGSDAGSFTMNLDAKPSKDAVKVDKPANAKPLAQVMSELGLGDLTNAFGGGGTTGSTGTPTFDPSLYQ